jgi:hypothetical protein
VGGGVKNWRGMARSKAGKITFENMQRADFIDIYME